jgi:hypothetical protein
MEPPQISNMFVTAEGKLALQWGMPEVGYHGIVVSLSLHPDFMEAGRRMFVLPAVTQCTLDCGKGSWFVSIGGCEGSRETGKVNWSGVYGPVLITSTKMPPALENNPIKPIHTQQLQNGFRVHAEHSVRHGFLIERCAETDGGSRFPIGTTRWFYAFDKGMGSIDCKGMKYPDLYSIRISTFDMAPVENPAFPWKDTFPTKQIFTVSKGIVFSKKTAAKIKLHQVRETNAVDALIVEQRKANPNMKFASHTDYLRYVIAQERMGDTKQSI